MLPAWGQPAADQTRPAAPVLTRAIVRSLPSAAEPDVIRLKLVPRRKLPFTTLAFAVGDAALPPGLAVGDEVGFAAEGRQDTNTLVRLRKVAPCVRFQPCPDIVE